jgi:hypothetical protein
MKRAQTHLSLHQNHPDQALRHQHHPRELRPPERAATTELYPPKSSVRSLPPSQLARAIPIFVVPSMPSLRSESCRQPHSNYLPSPIFESRPNGSSMSATTTIKKTGKTGSNAGAVSGVCYGRLSLLSDDVLSIYRSTDEDLSGMEKDCEYRSRELFECPQ